MARSTEGFTSSTEYSKKGDLLYFVFLFYDHFTSQTLMHVKYYDHETGTFYHYLACLCYRMI